MVLGGKLRDRADPTTARAWVEGEADKELSKFKVGDLSISIAPKDAKDRISGALAGLYDDKLAEDLLAFDEQVTRRLALLDQAVADSEQPPRIQNDTRELVLLMKLKGRTLADVSRMYTSTTDQADPVLVRLIESERDVLGLTPHKSDVESLQTLQDAIRQRREARRDKQADNARQALRSSLESVVLSSAAREQGEDGEDRPGHVRDSRGFRSGRPARSPRS
jgi:hypothetical protein